MHFDKSSARSIGYLGAAMDDVEYRKWIETIDVLSEAQRVDLWTILAGRSSKAEVIAALERWCFGGAEMRALQGTWRCVSW